MSHEIPPQPNSIELTAIEAANTALLRLVNCNNTLIKAGKFFEKRDKLTTNNQVVDNTWFTADGELLYFRNDPQDYQILHFEPSKPEVQPAAEKIFVSSHPVSDLSPRLHYSIYFGTEDIVARLQSHAQLPAHESTHAVDPEAFAAEALVTAAWARTEVPHIDYSDGRVKLTVGNRSNLLYSSELIEPIISKFANKRNASKAQHIGALSIPGRKIISTPID